MIAFVTLSQLMRNVIKIMTVISSNVSAVFQCILRGIIAGNKTPDFNFIKSARFFSDSTNAANYTLGGSGGTHVTNLEDLSGNAYDLAPSSADLGPVIANFPSTSIPGLRFLGATSNLKSSVNLLNGSSCDLFFVSHASSSTTAILFQHGTSEEEGGVLAKAYVQIVPIVLATSRLQMYYYDGETTHQGVTTNNVYGARRVLHLRFKSDGDLEVSINGGDYETIMSVGAPFNFSSGVMTWGNGSSNSSSNSPYLSPPLVYEGNLSQANANYVISYLADLYNVTLEA